jgi:hypothetical protein
MGITHFPGTKALPFAAAPLIVPPNAQHFVDVGKDDSFKPPIEPEAVNDVWGSLLLSTESGSDCAFETWFSGIGSHRPDSFHL